MNGMRDIEGLGQDFPDTHENEPLDAQIEQVIVGHSDVGSTPANFSENANFVEAPLEPHSASPYDDDSDRSVASEEEEDEDEEEEEEEKDVLPPKIETGSGDVGQENMGDFMEMDDKDEAIGPKENNATDESLRVDKAVGESQVNVEGSNQSFAFDPQSFEGDESGTEEEQAAFMKELENFFKERKLEFKPPKFYGEGLNCLKLWRAVTKLGGYDTALLDYERHKVRGGELCVPIASPTELIGVGNQVGGIQASGSGRARRDAAARAMQGWHSQRLLGNGEVGDPIIKDKSTISLAKREKHLKSLGVLRRKKPSSYERAVKTVRAKGIKQHDGQIGFSASRTDTMVVDIGPSADWVKVNVRQTKDCFEIYALVPGLLREEVRVQSDPAGRLVISGDPEQPDNPWGVTSFKKVVSLPSRIDPHQTSAVVTLHGQLFVRAPFEQSEL
ncbi:ARID/BRIGHT DNA-binding domain-containing protein [Cinnamomum micranthum f. kanehirae]|uniref:ARID/BRIGHT DNA-binding domain-containing protein n=1 Tax=Cinnamomum micranthum f. kanehirae TaxID=337451 RepID=A0A443NIE9_9MAGN|nr:ARID/BRIGHT DNA-binding domain-containing protein [Cinnamomum micranthum f. kanehirae]